MSGHDNEWVKSQFETLRCVTQRDPHYELANPAALTFSIPREEFSEVGPGHLSGTIVKDHDCGILIYDTRQSTYSGFFPGDGKQKATRIIPCTNGPHFDTTGQEHKDKNLLGTFPDDLGTCTAERISRGHDSSDKSQA